MVLNNNSTFKPIVCLFSLFNGWMADRYCAGIPTLVPYCSESVMNMKGVT